MEYGREGHDDRNFQCCEGNGGVLRVLSAANEKLHWEGLLYEKEETQDLRRAGFVILKPFFPSAE